MKDILSRFEPPDLQADEILSALVNYSPKISEPRKIKEKEINGFDYTEHDLMDEQNSLVRDLVQRHRLNCNKYFGVDLGSEKDKCVFSWVEVVKKKPVKAVKRNIPDLIEKIEKIEEMHGCDFLINSHGGYSARCRSCQSWVPIECDIEDFEPDMHYCGEGDCCFPL